MPKLRPTTWLAFGFLAIGVLAVCVAIVSDRFDAWTPNIATESFSLAATVGIVDWIVRREARERVKPRVELTMHSLRQEFRSFLSKVEVDYACSTFTPSER